MPGEYQNDNQLNPAQIITLADAIKAKAAEIEQTEHRLQTPETILLHGATLDGSQNSLFFNSPIESLKNFRLDSAEALYMPTTQNMYIFQGRDIQKQQNMIKLFDYQGHRFKQLSSDTCNSNFITLKNRLVYLKLLSDNTVKVVDYDCEKTKKASEINLTHSLTEVDNVCIVEDYASVLGVNTIDDVKQNLVVGLERNLNWEFYKISDMQTVLWRIEGH